MMTVEHDRRIRSDERPVIGIVLAWLVACIAMTAMNWSGIVAGQAPGPDDTMRLVQVRDLLAGQGWFDLHQYRVAPPAGELMHWSRLVDLPLALIIGLLTPLLGQGTAEIVALIAVPLLTLLACMFVVGMLAWRLVSREVAIFSCLCLALFPLVLMQVQPLRIDHHAYQILSVLAALWAISWRKAAKGAAVAGAAIAVGLTISLELLPLTAAFAGVLLLRWLRDPRERYALTAFMQALAASLVLLFFATRGLSDLVPHCDVITPAHLIVFLIGAVGVSFIASIGRLAPAGVLGGLAALGAVGGAVFLLSAPACAASPFGTLDPLVYRYWYLNVLEGRPIWHHDWEFAVPMLAQMLVALGASIVIMLRNSAWLRRYWMEYTLILGAAILAGLFTTRSLAFAGAIGAIPLGWLAVTLLAWWGEATNVVWRVLAPLGIAVTLLPSFPLAVYFSLAPEDKPESTARGNVLANADCDIAGSIAKLGGLPTGTVFAQMDFGPRILEETRHSVISTSHHRVNIAMRDTIRGFSAQPDAARAIMAEYAADYVAVCTDLPESNLYDQIGEDGNLMERLKSGDTPAWLTPVALDTPSSFKVWRVAPQTTAAPRQIAVRQDGSQARRR